MCKQSRKIICVILPLVWLFSQKVGDVQAEEYRYDELNRVVRVDYEDGSFVEYEYDKNGNLVNTTVNVPQEEEKPEVTKTPEKPQVTKVPEKPEVTKTPEKPEVTKAPEKPEVTKVPEKPKVTKAPEKPKVTKAPEKPKVTKTPEKPKVEKPEVTQVPKKPEAGKPGQNQDGLLREFAMMLTNGAGKLFAALEIIFKGIGQIVAFLLR